MHARFPQRHLKNKQENLCNADSFSQKAKISVILKLLLDSPVHGRVYPYGEEDDHVSNWRVFKNNPA